MDLKGIFGTLLTHYNKITFKLTMIITTVFFWLYYVYPESLGVMRGYVDNVLVENSVKHISNWMNIFVEINSGFGCFLIILIVFWKMFPDIIRQESIEILMQEIADCLLMVSCFIIIGSVTFAFLVDDFYYFINFKYYLACLPFLFKMYSLVEGMKVEKEKVNTPKITPIVL